MDNHALWTDEELSSSLDVYLFMLRLEAEGIPFVKNRQEKGALIGPLTERSLRSIQSRLRNISFVLQELGYQPLKAYKSAEHVGTHVRKRIELMLADRAKELENIRSIRTKKIIENNSLEDVYDIIESLKSVLKSLGADKEVIGIGHNNPPDAISLQQSEIEGLIKSATDIQAALSGPKLTEKKFREITAPILAFGQKLSQWLGSRITEFAQEAAKAAGKSVGVATGGLLVFDAREKIIDAISSAFNFLF